MRASDDRGLLRATDNSIKAPIVVYNLLPTKSTTIFPHIACARIETTFLEIDAQLKALQERVEKQCK